MSEAAWVIEAEDPRDVQRALRVMKAEEARWIAETIACVAPGEPPGPKIERKVERKIGHEVELRLDCGVAFFPLGRGYVALTIEPPAMALEELIDGMRFAYHELIRPANLEEPVRVCLPLRAVADPLSLAEALKDQGIGVLAVYEVGGCRR